MGNFECNFHLGANFSLYSKNKTMKINQIMGRTEMRTLRAMTGGTLSEIEEYIGGAKNYGRTAVYVK